MFSTVCSDYEYMLVLVICTLCTVLVVQCKILIECTVLNNFVTHKHTLLKKF